jgi:hypothetical protein
MMRDRDFATLCDRVLCCETMIRFFEPHDGRLTASLGAAELSPSSPEILLRNLDVA